MSEIHLVADSTCDVSPTYAAEHNLTIVPLRVLFGEEEFRDHFDISPATFYERMATGTVAPRTSQPTPQEFEEAFRQVGRDGKPIVCTTISADLSGTWNSAVTARQACADLDIHVIDTRSGGPAHRAVVDAVLTAMHSGASLEVVQQVIEEVIATQRLVFTLESLEYLRRGGRIGAAQALLGSVLNIKPVLEVHDGKVKPLDKVRTYQRAQARLVEELQHSTEKWESPAAIVVAHASRPEQAAAIAEQCRPYAHGDIVITEVGPVIGCHTGPGGIGLAYHRPLPS